MIDVLRLESDRELLQAFKRGDRAALTMVYRAYVGHLASKTRDGFPCKSIPDGPHRVPAVEEE